MTREIKFRAWDKINQKIYPVNKINFIAENGVFVHMVGHPYENNSSVTAITFDKLMQFTGLKDKNNKEIYEGDILKDERNEILLVVWGEGEWLAGKLALNANNFLGKCKYLEVIGNIYENPELLNNLKQ